MKNELWIHSINLYLFSLTFSNVSLLDIDSLI